MDYDLAYRNKIYKAMKVREYLESEQFKKEVEHAAMNKQIAERKKELVEKITQGQTKKGNLEDNFYDVVQGLYLTKDNFDIDESLSVAEKAKKLEYQKQLRSKFTLRKKLSKLFELEARKEFLNDSSYFEVSIPESEYEQKVALGRNYKKNSYELNQSFVNRLLQRHRKEAVGMSGLRVDPEIAQLVDVIIYRMFDR